MQLNSLAGLMTLPPTSATFANQRTEDKQEVREAFDQFVGETFFGQLLSSMRKSVDKPAYFHGGRAEEVFQSQLDQLTVEQMTKASAETFTGPMFELFMLGRN